MMRALMGVSDTITFLLFSYVVVKTEYFDSCLRPLEPKPVGVIT